MWTILEEGRDDYGRGFGMRGGSELEEAYREGGYNGGGSYSDMGERRMPGYFPEYPRMDEMGERRRRRANGEFY